MRKIIATLVASIATLAVVGGASATTYGQPDGGLHPNVGALIADFRQNGHPDVLCSGSLISPTVFLTASHCTAYLDSKGISQVWVTFDSKYVEGKSKLIAGTAHTNPAYNQAQSDPGDIAVITLSKEVNITPVQLPTAGLLDQMKKAGTLNQSTVFTSVGYGVHEPVLGGGQPYFPFTSDRNYAIGTFDALNNAWLRISQNNATGDGGTCFGDSGGPEFLGGTSSNLQVSLTVTGDAMCLATNVDYRIDTAAARAFLANYVTLP
ncbi:MAG TPA: trypsin-like serine protease [Gaiellaceae bacterium]